LSTKQSFSEDQYQHNEKQNSKVSPFDTNEKQPKKSRAEYLREWRKNNPEKVKEHRRKADRNYYQKNWKKYSDRAKISYHQYYMIHAIPEEYMEWIDEEWTDITADHEYFDSRYIPRNIWNHKCQTEPDEKQIEKNIIFVINLQRKGKIPIFLVYPLQTYLNQQKYSKERWKQVKELHRKKARTGYSGTHKEAGAAQCLPGHDRRQWQDRYGRCRDDNCTGDGR